MTSQILTSEHGSLPLPPVDHPRNLFVRALSLVLKRHFGKLPMAMRVLYARSPWLAFVSLVIGLIVEHTLCIERELRMLLQVSVSSQSGCTFCADIALAEALRSQIGRARFAALPAFESSALFSEREQAALAYTRALHESLHVSDAIWSGLAAHFSERERLEIVWVCAVERYYNSMSLPLRIGSDHLSELVH
jgi:alkylhydroperoxidase family enzyme